MNEDNEEFHMEDEDYESEDEFDYEEEEVVKDYDPFIPNSMIDKKLQEELKESRKFKPAEGVSMVEYDEFGFPKTKEMQELK